MRQMMRASRECHAPSHPPRSPVQNTHAHNTSHDTPYTNFTRVQYRSIDRSENGTTSASKLTAEAHGCMKSAA
jgi:hypothetical protein